MRIVKPTQSNRDVPPTPENKALASVISCGCGVLFLGAGLLPFLALLNILPRAGFFGNASPSMVVIGSLASAAVGLVGLYFIDNAGTLLGSRRRLSDRLLFNLAMFFLAISFHYLLFFGKPGGGSVTSISLPGGLVLSFFDTGNVSFVVKIAVALLLVVMDLYLISEILGLGWFFLEGSSPDEYRDDETSD